MQRRRRRSIQKSMIFIMINFLISVFFRSKKNAEKPPIGNRRKKAPTKINRKIPKREKFSVPAASGEKMNFDEELISDTGNCKANGPDIVRSIDPMDESIREIEKKISNQNRRVTKRTTAVVKIQPAKLPSFSKDLDYQFNVRSCSGNNGKENYNSKNSDGQTLIGNLKEIVEKEKKNFPSAAAPGAPAKNLSSDFANDSATSNMDVLEFGLVSTPARSIKPVRPVFDAEFDSILENGSPVDEMRPIHLPSGDVVEYQEFVERPSPALVPIKRLCDSHYCKNSKIFKKFKRNSKKDQIIK